MGLSCCWACGICIVWWLHRWNVSQDKWGFCVEYKVCSDRIFSTATRCMIVVTNILQTSHSTRASRRSLQCGLYYWHALGWHSLQSGTSSECAGCGCVYSAGVAHSHSMQPWRRCTSLLNQVAFGRARSDTVSWIFPCLTFTHWKRLQICWYQQQIHLIFYFQLPDNTFFNTQIYIYDHPQSMIKECCNDHQPIYLPKMKMITEIWQNNTDKYKNYPPIIKHEHQDIIS